MARQTETQTVEAIEHEPDYELIELFFASSPRDSSVLLSVFRGILDSSDLFGLSLVQIVLLAVSLIQWKHSGSGVQRVEMLVKDVTLSSG